MFEWIDSIDAYFTQLGDSINTLVSDTQILIDNLNAYITLSTRYIYGSGFILAILLICMFILLGKTNRMKIQLEQQDKDMEYIIELLEKQAKKSFIRGELGNGYNDNRGDESDQRSS